MRTVLLVPSDPRRLSTLAVLQHPDLSLGEIPPGVPGAQIAGSRPAGDAGGGASGAARTNPNITLNAQASAAGRGGAPRGPRALRKPGICLQPFPSAAGRQP